jgi:GNAT superfamily N-acetyltransferase
VSLARNQEYKDCGTDNTNNSIHSLGQVGHIEDIAVAKDQQGKKLGLRIIQALDFVAEKVGCYKVCSIHGRNIMTRIPAY